MKLYLKLYVAFCFALVLAMLSVGIIIYQIDDYFEINNNTNFYNNRIEGAKKVLTYILISEGFNCYLLEKKSLLKLTIEKVKSLDSLGEEHYFNIFATRTNV